jgi:hypothetical protein
VAPQNSVEQMNLFGYTYSRHPSNNPSRELTRKKKINYLLDFYDRTTKKGVIWRSKAEEKSKNDLAHQA